LGEELRGWVLWLEVVGCSDICISYVNKCKINSVSPKRQKV